MPTAHTTLHCLSPLGCDTPNVESLTSYFCRLSTSHSTSSRDMAAWILTKAGQPVPDDFRWFRRSFSGCSPETAEWASRLSALTGVSHLERLTLVPWAPFVSRSRLCSTKDRWCPACLTEDYKSGATPYLRLLWDVSAAVACPGHKVQLVHTCPHCEKHKVRHRASFVIPGYCTSCGGFLGDAETTPASSHDVCVAEQIGALLALPPEAPTRPISALLQDIVVTCTGGNLQALYALHLPHNCS